MNVKTDKFKAHKANRRVFVCPTCGRKDKTAVTAFARLDGLSAIIKVNIQCINCKRRYKSLLYYPESF